MGCEKAKGGFMSSIRSSMERRPVSVANVTSSRQRKNQELTMQREYEKLERAKEILERRKSERDSLNAYNMHSVGNPLAKHPDHLRGMRRLRMEGKFGRPPWTASLRSDYETLINLTEKEIAVATLRIENHKQLPNKCTQYSEAKDRNYTNESEEPYLSNEEFEFPQDTLEPEFADIELFDTDHKSNGSPLRNDLEYLENLENELLTFANETEKYDANIGEDLLLMEPTVFREHSFNSLKTGARSLPPRPPSNWKGVTAPLKSCLKLSNKDYPRSLGPLSETPRISQALSEQMPSRTSLAIMVATSNMENAIVPVSNASQREQMSKTMTNNFLNPWGNQQNMDYSNESFDVPFDVDCKEHLYPQLEEKIDMPALPISMSTVSNVISPEERATIATISSNNALSEPEIVRPNVGRQMESESPNMPSCSGIDTPFQETQGGNSNIQNASSPSVSVQLAIKSTRSTLPPWYTSTSESWQEDRGFESPIPDEGQAPPLASPPERYEDKNCGSEELENFNITSLDSEAATTRLIAEVLAVQSRLEDCKLKPLDFRDIFAEPFLPDRGCSRLEQRGRAEITPAEDLRAMRNSSPIGGHELVDGQNEQEVIEVNMRNHEIFTPMDTSQDEARENILDTEYREEEKTAENAPNGVDANSIDDDHEESALPVKFHSEKVIPSRDVIDQQPSVKHVTVQTDAAQEQSGENLRRQLGLAGISTSSGVLHCTRAENTAEASDCSLMSTERASKYLNIGYRDLSEAPRIMRHSKHCFYSSQGLLQVGYSQPRQSPGQPVKQIMNVQSNRQAQAAEFHDALGEKENYGMLVPDDQELSILASLERLDRKLAAMSARAMKRTNPTPSLVSQDQTSIQSAPAATRIRGEFWNRRPGMFPTNPMRSSSVSTLKPPTRNFRQRRIVGMTNKFLQDVYN